MTALASSVRFMQPGVTKVHWLPTIAAYPAAATRPEIAAGTELSGEVADLAGFSSKAEFIDTPDLSGAFIPKVAGRIKADDSSLTFYADKTSTDVRGTLHQGDAGFIVWMDGGDVATTGKMIMFKVTVASVTEQRNIAGTEVMRILVDFAQTKAPSGLVAIPT
jgi:hypothetical protein